MSLKRLVGALLLALAPAGSAWAQAEPMVLAVTVNSERKADLFVLREPGGRLLLRVEDLPALGLAAPAAEVPRLRIDGEPHVRLDALQGLRATLDEPALRLDLQADPQLLARTVRGLASHAPRFEHLGESSAFLNWAVQHTQSGESTARRSGPDYALEGGARLGPVLLQAAGHTATDGSGRFVRATTSLTHDRPQDLQRWVVGDFFTTPADLGGGVALGGLSVSRQFGLDPYRSRTPMGVVQGQASLPSEVDLYVDGQLVRSERVRPGEFEIRDIDTRQGTRNVQVVVRDTFGRTTTWTQDLYASASLLRAGLHEYQVAVGALRRRYGEASADYGAPAFSAWHRVGVQDALTLGAHAQGRGGLLHAGPMATARLGAAGVLSATAAWSRWEGGPGRALSLHHVYESDRGSAGIAWRHESAGYAVLGEPVGRSNRKQALSVYASRAWPQGGTVSISHTRQTVHEAAQRALLVTLSPRATTSLGYSVFLPQWRASLRASLAHVRDDLGARLELRLGLSLLLGERDAAAIEVRSAGAEAGESVQLRRHLPAGPGWGYDLVAERLRSQEGPQAAWRGEAQYQGTQGLLRGAWRHEERAGGAHDEQRLAASGGIAWVGGRAHLSRPIRDSFAVARVGSDLPEVPVTLGGEVVGLSDAHGEVFLPALSAFHEAEIAIDPQGLPVDHGAPRLRRRVVLPARTGAVVDFGVARVRAVVARLVGQPPLAGVPVRVEGAGPARETVTGNDGLLYLEQLGPGRHTGEAGPPGAACRFTLEVPDRDEAVLELGEVRCAGGDTS